jgi:hypothetical protein
MSKYIRSSLISAGVYIWLTVSAALPQTQSQNAANYGTQAQVAGVWRGNSVCAVENSPCHNEVNVYRISDSAGKPGWFSITGVKIVDGKEVVMGTSNWKYDPESNALTSESPAGKFRLMIDGRKMQGTLTLNDGTIFRRIYLQKEN